MIVIKAHAAEVGFSNASSHALAHGGVGQRQGLGGGCVVTVDWARPCAVVHISASVVVSCKAQAM